jgi:hypothetical protein
MMLFQEVIKQNSYTKIEETCKNQSRTRVEKGVKMLTRLKCSPDEKSKIEPEAMLGEGTIARRF